MTVYGDIMMNRNDLKDILNWDSCEECGACLSSCRYINFSKQEAVAEIKKVNKGQTSDILKKCISCYACNAFCPNDAHPYERIIFDWEKRYQKEGLPKRASYLMPGRSPNFREDLNYSPEERVLLEKWKSNEPPSKIVLYPGCNILTMPLLLTGDIFDKLPVWGNWDLCCGEMYFRSGLFSKTKETADKLTQFYMDKGIEEMVFICPAGYNMFTNVLPKQFGATFNFKTTVFTDWFSKELEKGTFKIKKQVNRSVVFHDSCHARILGDEFMENQRAVLKKIGVTVNETPLNKKDGLCCGMASGANKYSVIDLVKSSMKELMTLDKAPGDDAAIYCTGCLLMLSCVRPIKPIGKRLVHTVEYFREAIGEEVPRKNMVRAMSMIKGIATNSLPHYFSKERFKF